MNIGVIDGLSSIFGNLASLLGGHIYQRVGNVIPFYIITGLYGLTIVYIILFIRDREDIRSREKPGIGSLFTVKNLEDNFQMLKKDRIGATRLHIWLTLLSVLVFSICIAGRWLAELCGWPRNWNLRLVESRPTCAKEVQATQRSRPDLK